MSTLNEQLTHTIHVVDNLIQGAHRTEMLDIPGLERTIIGLCAQSQACTGNERGQVRTAMQVLIGKLDTLSSVLQQQKEAFATELKSTTSGQQAAKAYLKAKKR
jgi:hypothetical protein